MRPTSTELKKAILDAIQENGYKLQVPRLFNLLSARYPDITQEEIRKVIFELANEMKRKNEIQKLLTTQ